MKKRCLIVLTGLLVTGPAAGVMALDRGPEAIDLKERYQVEGGKKAVIFPHYLHQAGLSCADCHQDPAGGGSLVVEFVNKSGIANDFHKKFCWPCHEEKRVPKGKSCSTCHK